MIRHCQLVFVVFVVWIDFYYCWMYVPDPPFCFCRRLLDQVLTTTNLGRPDFWTFARDENKDNSIIVVVVVYDCYCGC